MDQKAAVSLNGLSMNDGMSHGGKLMEGSDIWCTSSRQFQRETESGQWNSHSDIGRSGASGSRAFARPSSIHHFGLLDVPQPDALFSANDPPGTLTSHLLYSARLYPAEEIARHSSLLFAIDLFGLDSWWQNWLPSDLSEIKSELCVSLPCFGCLPYKDLLKCPTTDGGKCLACCIKHSVPFRPTLQNIILP